ncbi:hypothetical protein ACLOJK_032784 [Asimina triloba]
MDGEEMQIALTRIQVYSPRGRALLAFNSLSKDGSETLSGLQRSAIQIQVPFLSHPLVSYLTRPAPVLPVHSLFLSCILTVCLYAAVPFRASRSTKPAPVETNPALVLHRERSYEVDEESWVLQKAKFESIATSNEIRDALKDEELQKLVCKIDCSPDAENELDKAMQLEAFRVFTDKVIYRRVNLMDSMEPTLFSVFIVAKCLLAELANIEEVVYLH